MACFGFFLANDHHFKHKTRARDSYRQFYDSTKFLVLTLELLSPFLSTIFTSLVQLYDVFVVETFHDDDDDVYPPPPLARARPRVVFFGVSASLFLDGEDGGVRVCGKTTDDDDARGGGKEREEHVARLDFRLGRR